MLVAASTAVRKPDSICSACGWCIDGLLTYNCVAWPQVNAGGTCLLYHTIGKLAGVGRNSLLLDVCCGTGTIGLTLAKQVRMIV